MSRFISESLKQERARWLAAIHAVLDGKTATSHVLIKSTGVKGYNEGCRVAAFMRTEPTIRHVCKVPGPTGHPNWLWERTPEEASKSPAQSRGSKSAIRRIKDGVAWR